MARDCNLLHETQLKLSVYNKKPEDVLFVTDGNFCCSWSDFAKKADRLYNNGYGGNEVNEALKIVGNDWWLERHEYDGSEWWEFKSRPMLINPGNVRVFEDDKEEDYS